MYAPNNSTSKYREQKLIKLKGEIDNFPNTVGDIITLSQQLIGKAGKSPPKTWRIGTLSTKLSQMTFREHYAKQ